MTGKVDKNVSLLLTSDGTDEYRYPDLALYAAIDNYLQEKRPVLSDEAIECLQDELAKIENRWSDVKMDYSRPIIYRDEETGEIIYGGADNPIANKRRARLNEQANERLKQRYNETTVSPPNQNEPEA